MTPAIIYASKTIVLLVLLVETCFCQHDQLPSSGKEEVKPFNRQNYYRSSDDNYRAPRPAMAVMNSGGPASSTRGRPEFSAIVQLHGVSGINSDIRGTLTFKQEDADSPVRITGTISGVPPRRDRWAFLLGGSYDDYGLTIHESGDLRRGCYNAKAHFNPRGRLHGGPSQRERHVGDLGNVKVSPRSGVAEVDLLDYEVSLQGKNSVVGRGLVLHSNRDDLGRADNRESEETGNSGDRIACGVIAWL